ncbi:MAG: hypothetical protein JW776_11930 [Candidatus Lokiarchaeota archaeon]|nr:hypothetical protein [Candidatus Lokiarchaeota archaeon]
MEGQESSDEIRNDVFWRKVVFQYWYIILIFLLLIAGAITGFILTLKWYTEVRMIVSTGETALSTFNEFSMRSAVRWIVFLVLWELLIVFLPFLAVGGGIFALVWYVILPENLKEEMKLRSKKEEEMERKKKHRKNGDSGVFGLLMFVGLCIYIAVNGNWQTEFGSLNLGYFVDAWIRVFIWIIIIFVVPAIVITSIWFILRYGKEK